MKSVYLYFLVAGVLLSSACSSSRKTTTNNGVIQETVQAKPKTPVYEEEPAKPKTKTPTKSKTRMLLIETSLGNMIVELFNETPQHRDNFIKLAKEGFFDDLLFHRVIRNFMIQGGDPNSRDAAVGQPLGTGGPGYTVPAEFNKDFLHLKGALSAARQGDQVNPQKASSGSQFYIVQGKLESDEMLNQIQRQKGIEYSTEQREAYKTIGGTPFLDMDYTVFGRVVEGLEVIDKIAAVQTDRRAGDRPVENVTMKVKVIR